MPHAEVLLQRQAFMLDKLRSKTGEVLHAGHALGNTGSCGQVVAAIKREAVNDAQTTVTHDGGAITGKTGVFKQCVIVAALYPLLLSVSIPDSSDYIITLNAAAFDNKLCNENQQTILRILFYCT